jgi:dsRNA-specific ribonuclease
LWVLGVSETRLFPDEAELEEELKHSNPKGRLLELCMRLRIDPPAVELQQQGAFYLATMTLQYQDQTLSNAPCRAASKKTAEQMAARSLLDAISQRDRKEQLVYLTDDDAVRLQSANPKGRLLEWCAKSKTPPPRFEQEAAHDGYRIRAVLTLDDPDEIVSGWFAAKKLKIAEQAAAEAILRQLPDTACPQATTTGEVAESRRTTTEASPGPNPAVVVNELTQAGLLHAAGYDQIGQTGPSHQPTFTMVAWAKLGDGRTLRTDPAHATSKKSAQRAAANALLNLLVEEGITRR